MAKSKQSNKAASSSWFPTMQCRFVEGALTQAAALYDEHETNAPYAAVLLRARIYLKQGDDPSARSLLRSHLPPAKDKAARARHALLTGAAHTVSGRYDVADEELAYAQRLSEELHDQELRSETAYRQCLRYAMSGDLEQARTCIPRIRQSSSLDAIVNASFAEEYIFGKQQRYLEQAETNLKLLKRLQDTTGHEEARIHATWNAAVMARELHLPQSIPYIQRNVEVREWPSDFSRQRFETLKALGWCHALQGDYFNAFRWLKNALLECAKAPQDDVGMARLCVAHLDRAYLARCASERIFERQEIDDAETLASRVNWVAVTGEERVALLLLAETLAPLDAGRATYYIAKYDSLPGLNNKLQHFTGDERVEHLADYSRAMVDLVSGHRKSAASLLRKTYAFYERVQYSWRAGRCALRLFEITGEQRWLDRAKEMLRNYGAGWLGEELRSSGTGDAITDLPPMQRKVFEAICQGLSNREIAEQLGRSEFTVRNHVKAVLHRFGVSSRSALIAEALKRKML